MNLGSEQAKAIFLEAIEHHAPEQWPAFVEQACAGDVMLRAMVEKLLHARGELGSFHEQPRPTMDETSSELPGSVIGPYKLLQELGEGGMGTVYMAEQTQPVQRRVALKVIKPGMDSRQVIARFEAERQALALMDHVNIARVLDAGTTENGRPYFVMELVHGAPITKYCDDNQLTPRERLELFVPVCKAIQHAHQKGIIHRDIKPSNVMVTLYDGKPVPKVIDFGVAKAIEQKLTERTLFTQYGTMVGTPQYMSPEQAEMSALGVDTRSDIYSLGVLLYELLTGSTPLTQLRFKEAAYGEILRMIKEEEPPKPSTRLSDSGVALVSISAQRKTEPAKLAKLVRGELDWIVMKTLEKDRNRRYETANDFATDLQRYLADEPVQACPPSTAYRLRKFVRRNKGAVVGASAFALLLLVGIVTTTWQAWRATQAERQARDNEQHALVLKDKSEANFQLARDAVDKYLNAVTDNPKLNENDFFQLRKELLETAVPFYRKFAEEKNDDPEMEAARGRAYHRLALVRDAMGEKEAALADYESMRAIFAKLAADCPDVPSYRLDLAQSHNNRGNLLAALARFEEAESAHRAALKIKQQLADEFPGDPNYSWEFAKSHSGLGARLKDLGRLEEAEAEFRAALSIQQKLTPTVLNDPLHRFQFANSHNNLGIVLKARQKYDEAETIHLAARKLYEQLVAEFPKVAAYRSNLAGNHNNLANVREAQHQSAEAEMAHRAALLLHRQLIADFSSVPEYRQDMAMSHSNLGGLLRIAGRFDESETEYQAAIGIQARLAADFPGVPIYALALGMTYRNLGYLELKRGRPQQSLDWLEKAIITIEPVLKMESRLVRARVGLSHANKSRAEMLESVDRHGEAAKHWDRAIELADGPTRARYAQLRNQWREYFGDHSGGAVDR